MTQEEKLEEAKRLYETANADQKYVLERLFPELEESEDEKIRKGLIAIITDFESLYLQENYALSKEDILAWLEKQGEQNLANSARNCKDEQKFAKSEDEKIRKDIVFYIAAHHKDDGEKARWLYWLEKQGGHAKFINGIQVGDKVTRNEDGVLVNLSQLNRVAKKDEKQGKQKPILDVEIPFGAKDSELKEVTYDIPKDYHAEIEDNKVVIKQGEQKPTWKPSDEQMLALEAALTVSPQCPAMTSALIELYEQLKKLREE